MSAEESLDGVLSSKCGVFLFEWGLLYLGLILPLPAAASILMSCWSRIAMYDSMVTLMTSELSSEAASIEQISKLAWPFLIAPVLYLWIDSVHFATIAHCSLWTPGGGNVCLEP